MKKQQFETIEKEIEDSNDNLESIKDSLIYLKVILTIFLLILLIGVIIIVGMKIEFPPSQEDYCDYHFGEGYYYNVQRGQPYEVRSCDYVERNGGITQKFFTITEYKNWRK